MNKKGFTLIELLAVIVILAIIALIATPIVLNIIEDSKKSATLRSAEFYMDAVDYAVANSLMNNKNIEAGEYKILENGNVCLKYDDADNTKCVDELIVEVNGEKPNSGTIKIEGNQTNTSALVFDNGTVNKDDSGEYIYVEQGNSGSDNDTQNNLICTLISGTAKTPGAKYECNVDPSKDAYTFYVLGNNEDGTTNLIMAQNINNDGTISERFSVTKAENPAQYSAIEWVSQEDYNDDDNYGENGNTNKGPITAMNFLYNATKSWTNVPALNYTYNDKEVQGGDYGYTSFVSADGVATITSATEPVVTTTIGTVSEPLRARMPIDDESNFNEYYGDHYYLLSNLYFNGYWFFSTVSGDSASVTYHRQSGASMIDNGGLSSSYVSGTNGVRPVITVEL